MFSTEGVLLFLPTFLITAAKEKKSVLEQSIKATEVLMVQSKIKTAKHQSRGFQRGALLDLSPAGCELQVLQNTPF